MNLKSFSKKYIYVLGILVIAGALATTYFSVRADAIGTPGSITIPTGSTYSALLDSLTSREGLIRHPGRLHTTARLAGLQNGVRPGHYRLKEGTSYLELTRMFKHGLQQPVRVTFNNIRKLPQLAERVSRQLEADSTAFARVLLTDTLPAHYGFTPETFIAMFIPDTYEMYWTTSPRAFTDRMKKEYDRFWNTGRMEKLARTGLSPTQAITLASIVYEETKKKDEMPTVAGVFINRLKINMPLQADPTLKFAAGDFTLRRVWDMHKKIDSPYNTYMYAGLPPGPISMPSVDAIDAVLNYAEHNYYYFVAQPNYSGYHDFSRTLAEHERKSNVYRAFLNREGIR